MSTQKAGRVLIINEDEGVTKNLAACLEGADFQVMGVKMGMEGCFTARSWKPDIVVLGSQLVDLDGLEVMKRIREKDEGRTGIVFLFTKNQTKNLVLALDQGADDCLSIPVCNEEFLARIRSQIRIKKIRDDFFKANLKLTELVDQDDLTGLYNMRSFYEKMQKEIQRAQRFGRAVCAVMIDLDYFKLVNDHHDHLFGSFVLKKVGHLIKENIRSIDIAARYGGDEFLIFLTETDIEGARFFCERLRQKIANHHFIQDREEKQLTCSIGLAVARPKNEKLEAKDLVRMADKALYDAKNSGRNKVISVDLTSISGADWSQIYEINQKRWRKFG